MRRSRWVLAAAPVAIVVVAIACGESLTPIRNEDDAGDGGSVADSQVAPPGNDSDVPVPDPVDASDAGPDYCATIDASFCWSFDRGASSDFLLAEGKLRQAASGAGQIEIAPGNSVPNAARFFMVVEAVPATRSLDLTLGGLNPRHASCHVAFIVDVAAANGSEVDILKLNAGPTMTPKVTLKRATTGDNLDLRLRRDQANDDDGIHGFLPNTWIDLTFALDINASNIEATANVMGSMFTAPKQIVVVDSAALSIAEFRFGALGTTGAWQVRFDDVHCRYY